MKKTAILSIVAAVVIGCLLTSARGQPNQRDKAARDMPFKGQALLVNVKSDPQHGTGLRNCSIKTFAGTEFIVGESIDPGSWLKGHTAWISLADIYQITEFKDGDNYTKATQEFEEEQKRRFEEDQKFRTDLNIENLRRLKDSQDDAPTEKEPEE